jgi:hypothetical protein
VPNSSSPTNFRQFRYGLLGSQESRVPHRKAAYPMHPNSILHEVQQLYNVSDRLDSLAGQHPLVSEALIGISGSVRNTATLLELVVAMKLPTLSGLDPANA